MDLITVAKTFIGANDRHEKYFDSFQRSCFERNISCLRATIVFAFFESPKPKSLSASGASPDPLTWG